MYALGATAQCHKGPSQDRAGHHTHQPLYFHIKPKRDYHALGSMLNPIGKGQRQAKQSKAKQSKAQRKARQIKLDHSTILFSISKWHFKAIKNPCVWWPGGREPPPEGP